VEGTMESAKIPGLDHGF